MVAWIKSLFYVPKHGKVSEKVVMNRITVTVISILVYLTTMSLTAYAYFAHSASTAVMTIRAASYDLEIIPENLSVSNTNLYVLKNENAEEQNFKFELKRVKGENAASLGYCKIKVKTDVNATEEPEDVQTFYTVPIGTFLSNGETITQDEITLFIAVPAGQQAVVQFSAEMGSCAIDDERIKNTDTILPAYDENKAPQVLTDPDEDTADKDATGTTATDTTKTTIDEDNAATTTEATQKVTKKTSTASATSTVAGTTATTAAKNTSGKPSSTTKKATATTTQTSKRSTTVAVTTAKATTTTTKAPVTSAVTTTTTKESTTATVTTKTPTTSPATTQTTKEGTTTVVNTTAENADSAATTATQAVPNHTSQANATTTTLADEGTQATANQDIDEQSLAAVEE